MSLFTENKQSTTYGRIATEPFLDNSVKVETKKKEEDAWGVAVLANTKTTLVRLKVVFDAKFALGNSLQYVPAESHVWVRADLYASNYGKEIFTVGDQKFILLPADRIEVFE